MSRLFPVLAALATASPAGAGSPNPSQTHWAFQPVADPPPPAVRDTAWPRDPIDHFVLAQLEAENLTPAPQADRRTLVRRLSFALTGLPPTPTDLDRHLAQGAADTDPHLATYVDQLLDSPQFGDHWARHWLDHVRYRPFPGKSLHNDPYRLWVVDAFNRDLPYTDFIRMQIAGDLLPGPDPDNKVHLDGMVAVRPFSLKNRPVQQLDLLGRTFMGLSLACAECHDHKHEPLTRLDYYALRGIFESSQVIKAPYLQDRAEFDAYMQGLAHTKANETRMKKELKEFARVSQLMDLRDRMAREREKLADPKEEKNHAKIAKNLEKMVADEKKRLEEIEKRDIALDAPEALEYIRLNNENKAFTERWKNVQQFDAFIDQTDPVKIKDTAPPAEGIVVKPGDDPPRDPPVPRRFPVALAGPDQQPVSARTDGSGRLQLAEWITAPDHPVTPRLMANRLWYYMLGEGIVTSLSNFGVSGAPPTHPQLLDHLATSLDRDGGSVKSLVRRIALSATFQQASHLDGLTPDTHRDRAARFAVARPKRLEAESLWRTLHELEHDPASTAQRRAPSIELVAETTELFDGADSALILPRRSSSVSPLQALFFLNSPHVKTSTEKIAARLLRAVPDGDDARVHLAYKLLLSRDPGADELAAARDFLTSWQTPPLPENARRDKNAPPHEVLSKWQAYLQSLLATNEFLFVD